MDDPYALPGSDCLANLLGVTDADQLRAVEARLVSIRDVQAARTTIHFATGDAGRLAAVLDRVVRR